MSKSVPSDSRPAFARSRTEGKPARAVVWIVGQHGREDEILRAHTERFAGCQAKTIREYALHHPTRQGAVASQRVRQGNQGVKSHIADKWIGVIDGAHLGQGAVIADDNHGPEVDCFRQGG